MARRRAGALLRQAADPARLAAAQLAGRAQQAGVGADLPLVKIVARTRPLGAEVRLIERFDDSFTQLWEELAPNSLAVRRDAAYLNWKYVNGAARALFHRRAAPRPTERRLCGLPALHRTARPGEVPVDRVPAFRWSRRRAAWNRAACGALAYFRFR